MCIRDSFETVPSHQLATALWLEADRMGQLLPAMTQGKLDTQRDVVKNERRWSVDNQPYGTWWERVPAIGFPPEHPFHHSLIGSMEDLSEASLQDVEQFFATYYTPDNAVLTIAGDFDPTDATDLVERYFGQIPRGAGKPPLADMSVSPTFEDPKRLVIQDEVMLPRIYLVFRSPVFGTEEHYDASVAGAILGMGKGSRLVRTLVREQQIASEVNVFTFDLAKGADLLVVDVTAQAGVSASVLEQAIVQEIDTMQTYGVTASEVERAAALIETQFTIAMQSAGERADKLSMFATYFRDPGLVNAQSECYRGVTAARVSRFAHDRLGAENRATLVYVPRDGELAEEMLAGAGANSE